MVTHRMILATLVCMIVLAVAPLHSDAAEQLDPYTMQEVFCRFPFAQVVPLDTLGAWGIIYADTYGRLHLLEATPRGWKLEWEVTNLGTKIRRFFIKDLDADGLLEIIIATVDGRILVYDMETYRTIWENLDDHFSSIEAIEVANVDDDPQLEFIYLADGYLYIIDGISMSKQWVSQRSFKASEIIIGNVDKDPQAELILNTGVVIDSRFFNVEIEWDKSFGDRIALYDMNNDGIPEIVGEYSDYSLRIFDVYARREVW
ncbi:MAG: hypothetical protein PHD74_09765 [Candidatus Krumholzibacteria bacterium]|nr:hypothetical protein [Candidatus Krumholzibacteria bacterium]